MKTIPLTKGAVALVDDEDYDRLMAYRWCYSARGYAVHYYTHTDGKKKEFYMHRMIMGAPHHLQVDHINRDKLDNRRQNLRFATRRQNQVNKGRQINNTSGYKGVSWQDGKWVANIRCEGTRLHLGRFDDPIEAARMYDTAARILNDDFALCNFPSEPIPKHLRERFFTLIRGQVQRWVDEGLL